MSERSLPEIIAEIATRLSSGLIDKETAISEIIVHGGVSDRVSAEYYLVGEFGSAYFDPQFGTPNGVQQPRSIRVSPPKLEIFTTFLAEPGTAEDLADALASVAARYGCEDPTAPDVRWTSPKGDVRFTKETPKTPGLDVYARFEAPAGHEAWPQICEQIRALGDDFPHRSTFEGMALKNAAVGRGR